MVAHQSLLALPPRNVVTGGAGHGARVALAGERAVRNMEVTTDGGKTWAPTPLVGPDLGPAAWRQFEYTFDAAPGGYTLASRATDAAGNTQPEQVVQILKGYRANGWREPAASPLVS